jgi:pyruvate/2-oxoglutarate dehydrogenase complex dihydrolipoamide acyltransferase (E2) component
MTMTEPDSPYREVEFPRIREGAIDLLREAHRKHMIHALTEVDVTDARRRIREHKARTGETLSFTAFIATCLAKAVDEDKTMHAYRRGKRKLVVFDEVDINIMVERQVGGSRMGTPNIIRAANKKSLRQIHGEIRAAQAGAVEDTRGMEWFRWAPVVARLPTWLRTLAWRAMQRNPHTLKRIAGTVGITAVGMFGLGGGWGITIPFLTLNVVLGGIAEKPGLAGGRVETREFLCVTISVDHDVVDGAPAARFAGRFKELIESGYGLAEAE